MKLPMIRLPFYIYLFLFIGCSNLYGQGLSLKVIGKAKKTSGHLEIRRDDELNARTIYEKTLLVKPGATTTYKVDINKPGLLKVNNRTILVGSSDSITIVFRDNETFELQSKYPGNFTIWDDVNVRYPRVGYKLSKVTLPEFISSLDSVYSLRSQILEKKKSLLSKDIYNYMASYLKYSHIYFMLKDINSYNISDISISDFSSKYFSIPSFADFKNDSYSDMGLYRLAGQSLAYFYAKKEKPANIDLQFYTVIASCFAGQTRSNLVDFLFVNYDLATKIPLPKLDSLMIEIKDFKLNAVAIKNIENEIHKATIKNKVISESVLRNSNLKDIIGNSITLAQLLKENSGKTIVFDFWASWCGPCIYEIPSMKQVKAKSKKLKIIYVSLDDNESAWLASVKKYDIKADQYLLSGNFKSALTEYLRLHSIPRYIVIDKDGRLTNLNAPPPSASNFYDNL